MKFCRRWGLFSNYNFLFISPLVLRIGSYLKFSRVLASWTLVSSFVFSLDIYFSRKKLLLINLNAKEICCNFIGYKNLFKNVGIMHASRIWSFYSINLQIRQIPTTNQNLPGESNPFSILILSVVLVEVSEKKTSVFLIRDFVTTG